MKSPIITFEQIYDSLKFAMGGFVENGVLTNEDVLQRARHLTEDLHILQLRDFAILPSRLIPQTIDGNEILLPLVEYTFGETRQDLDKSDPGHSQEEMSKIKYMDGAGLNHGDICYLSRVSEIGRQFIPNLWLLDDLLRQDLKNPKKHLSTLNEVWHLNLWPTLDPARIERAKKINPPTDRDVDWSFPLQFTNLLDRTDELRINLEIKDIFTSLETAIHGKYATPLKDIFEGIERDGVHKFKASSSNEINVVGISLLCPMTRLIENAIKSRFQSDCFIDAVVIWAPYDLRTPVSLFYNDQHQSDWQTKKALLQACIGQPTKEDISGCALFMHPDIKMNEMIHGRTSPLL